MPRIAINNIILTLLLIFDALEDVLDALQELLPGSVTREHVLSRDCRELSRVWLGQPFTRAKRLRGDREFVSIGLWSRERRLVTTLNQLEVKDVGEILEAEDPYLEAITIYVGLLEPTVRKVTEEGVTLSPPICSIATGTSA